MWKKTRRHSSDLIADCVQLTPNGRSSIKIGDFKPGSGAPNRLVSSFRSLEAVIVIEAMALRRWDFGNLFFNVRGMVPQPVFNEPLDRDTRMTREELKEVGGLYIDYLERKVTER